MISFFRSWLKDEDGMAAVEAALVFPVLLTLLLGTFDLGNGILANQKAIRASQVVADLITRNSTVDDAMVTDSIKAGELAFDPLDTSKFGVDIISVRFDEDGDPLIEWRETQNMTPLNNVEGRVASLADDNSGVVVVAVEYLFEPVFAGFVVNNIPMQEIAFAKGRKSSVVGKE